MALPISIAVKNVKVIEDTNELWSDEPYVVTCVIDLSNRVSVPGVGTVVMPNVATTLTGIWTGADTGDFLTTAAIRAGLPRGVWAASTYPKVARVPCWDFAGNPKVINDPDEIIILSALLEHDDSNSATVRSLVNSTIVASVNGLANDSSLSRADMIARLRQDMSAAISTAGATAVPPSPFNSDELLGIRELRLTRDDISKAEAGTHLMPLDFSGDGGRYRVRYELRNRSFFV